MVLAPSTRLGTYEIVGPLGAGGMGEVYRARDSRLQREVALKILPAAVAADPDRLARFEREARVLASLNHPNVGAIYGVEDSSGIPALVLELVEGATLEDRIAAGPLTRAEALSAARQIAAALEAAHDRGIVHRDLKPANIKFTSAGTVKVLDFGLAKAVADAPSSDDVPNSPTFTAVATRDGIILGTAPYMSPEQARGQPVDRRTDIWAFGCVLYEMLTGRRAFPGASVSDAIVSVLERDPDWSALPADTPPAIRRLLGRVLQKDAGARLRDIGDARFDLDEAVAPAEAASVPPAAGPRSIWRTAAWSIGSAVVTAVLAAVAWILVSATRVEPPAFSRVIRLVSTAAHEFAPAISPDGKWVAYLSNARGPADIWVKFLTGGDPVNLTASQHVIVQAQSGISGLEISPDGGLIAFSAASDATPEDTSTWVIPAPLGGVPRRLLGRGFHALRWSADGTKTVFIHAGGSAGDSVWVGDAEGQNGREILENEGGVHIHWPRWSADGRWIYFNYGVLTANSEPTSIFRVRADGGPVEPVITTTRRAVFALPTVDGRGLFYAANPDSVDLGLWWRDIRGGEGYRLTSGVGEYTEPSVSADGRRVVATVLDGRQHLARLRLGSHEPATLEPITDGFSGDIDPTWSPDGKRLVFSSSRTGARNLWWLPADLAAPAPLTAGHAMDARPAFSRDGTRIAFVSDRGGEWGVWMMAAESGTPRRIAPIGLLEGVSWSPDDRRLVAAVAGADLPRLVTIDTSDGKVEALATPEGASAPAWSPVQDLIAYLQPGGGTGTRLRFVTSEGRARPEMIAEGEPVQFGNGLIAWSPDGRTVAVAGLPGVNLGSIWLARIGAPPVWRRVIDLPPGMLLRGMTWSRDGSELIVGVIRLSGDIILAERDR